MDDAAPKTFAKRLRVTASSFFWNRQQQAHRLVRVVTDRNWKAFTFGGVPRGLWNYRLRYRPRDLDLVFDDENYQEFAHLFHNHVVRRTRFGGLHLSIDGLEVDAWPISATWAFREALVHGPSFPQLPFTTFLNIDGIVLEFATRPGRARTVYANGFKEALEREVLDVNLLANPFPALCVARTLLLACQYQLPLSHHLARYVLDHLETKPLAEIVTAQVKHYGTVFFTLDKLHILRCNLLRHIELSNLEWFPVLYQQWFSDFGMHKVFELSDPIATRKVQRPASLQPRAEILEAVQTDLSLGM